MTPEAAAAAGHSVIFGIDPLWLSTIPLIVSYTVLLSEKFDRTVVALIGAGLVIILTRPFTVGDTILVQDVSGVVDEVSLSATTLIGEDQEMITIPNRKVVGEILVNSAAHRIVESQIVIAAGSDPEQAIAAISKALADYPDMAEGSAPQVGIHDFSYGAIILGLRYWVPSSRYFRTRFEVNSAAYAALKGAGIELMSGGRVAILAEPPVS